MKDHVPEVLVPTIAFELNGIPYIPHYTMDGAYVAPGGVIKHRDELIKLNAKQTWRFLWERR